MAVAGYHPPEAEQLELSRETSMPIAPEDRPIAALREETIDQLIMNYGHGVLSLEAFERRLEQAFDARSHEALMSLTADLDLEVDRAYTEKKKSELGRGIDTSAPQGKDSDYMIHVFGGSNRGGRWTVARTIWMLNLFGGGELDFTDACFSARETRIRMLCLFGGANFYVPENVSTVSKALCIFGGIDNRAPSFDAHDAPTLVIEGLLLFGGVRVSVKKTWRERWLEFANNVREMFAPTSAPRPRSRPN
jgi:hypothetical protein